MGTRIQYPGIIWKFVNNIVSYHVTTTAVMDDVYNFQVSNLTHWGRVTHICVSKLNVIGSDNDLSPGRRQGIIGSNAGIMLIGPLGTNFSEIVIEIHKFSFKKMHLKISSGKCRPFCLGLNLNHFQSLLGHQKPKTMSNREFTVVTILHLSLSQNGNKITGSI